MKELINKAEEKMQKAIVALENDLKSVRAGRANPAILDRISVDYYGVPTKINQMAAISVPEARMLVIQPWDVSVISQIEKAIIAADLGINPTNDGKVIRMAFPQPTQERRRELVKDVSKTGEDAKVAVRSIRRDANEKLKTMKKNSEVSEDEMKIGEEKIQKLTDKFCKEVDSVIKLKEEEIMEI